MIRDQKIAGIWKDKNSFAHKPGVNCLYLCTSGIMNLE